jgi:hypothetical protein
MLIWILYLNISVTLDSLIIFATADGLECGTGVTWTSMSSSNRTFPSFPSFAVDIDVACRMGCEFDDSLDQSVLGTDTIERMRPDKVRMRRKRSI